MSYSIYRSISEKYCVRFGRMAVEMGFVSEDQLREGLSCQVNEDASGQEHRLLGAVFFSKGWMSSQQIDLVATELLKRMRKEAA